MNDFSYPSVIQLDCLGIYEDLNLQKVLVLKGFGYVVSF